MSKKGKPKEYTPSNLISMEAAYCAVDSTKCDGSCQKNNLENGFVFCSETITQSQAMSLRDKRKQGLAKKRRRYDTDYEDEYGNED